MNVYTEPSGSLTEFDEYFEGLVAVYGFVIWVSSILKMMSELGSLRENSSTFEWNRQLGSSWGAPDVS